MQLRALRSTGIFSLLTIGAFVLQAANLGSRSLWLDEGFTLMRIFGSWSDLWSNTVYWNGIRTTDTNPQVYFALLKAWSVFAGRSEFALEWFSLSGGAGFVALCIALARRAFGLRAALFAALFAALSPLVAWYSVELRMYSWVVNFSALSILLLQRFLERPSVVRFAVWAAAAGLSLATHYSFIGLIVAHVGFAAYSAMRMHRLRLVHWVGIGVASLVVLGALAVFLDAPALWARFRGGAEYSYEFKPLYDVIGSLASGALFGVNQTDPSGGWLSWIFVVVWISAAVYAAIASSRRLRVQLLLLSTVMPIAVWYALSLVKPNFSGVRHLMLILPPLLVVLAGALDGAMRRVPAAVVFVALLVTANGYGMLGVLLPSAEKEDDWRSVARTIRAEWRPEDIIVANSGTPREVVQGYLGDLPAPVVSVIGIDVNEVLRAGRIWYLNTGAVDATPDRGLDWVRALRMQQAYRFAGRTNTIELLLLAPDVALEKIPREAVPVAVDDASDDRIVGWQVLPPNPYAPTANMQLRLFWRRGSAADGERTLSLRLRSGDETLLDAALNARLPARSQQWTPGRLIAVDYSLSLPIGLPPLAYDIEIVSFDAVNGKVRQTVRAPLRAEQVACCVRYTAWQARRGASDSPEVIRYVPPVDAPASHGVIFSDALASMDHAGEALPGRPLFVGMTWADADGSWMQGVTLETLSGKVIAETSPQAPIPGLAASAWPAGEPVRTTIAVTFPDDAIGGWHRLTVWRDRGQGRMRAYVGLVKLVEYPQAPPNWPGEIQTPIDASAGEFSLLGVSVDGDLRPGRFVTVSTFWRVDEVPARDGVIFVHLIGPDGSLVVQEDHPPDNGARSTRTFRPGAGHREYSAFAVPADLDPGVYTLYVGIYDRDDLQRWPAQRAGAPAKDDLIAVREFTVKP